MNVPTELVKRTGQRWDTQDLALLYMEEEVGRHDWSNNWPKVKATGNVRDRVQAWLDDLHVDHSPDEIIEYLDKLVAERAGSWL